MSDAPAQADGFVVKLARSGKEVFVPTGGSILFALLDENLQIPFACGVGICGACWQRVVSGEPDHRDFVLSDEEREKGAVMICCAGSLTPELALDL